MSGEGERWREVEPVLRARAYDTLAWQPESLLEVDGGPLGFKADVILARLIGFDDQIVDDTLRLSRVEPELRVPIMPRLTRVDVDVSVPSMRTARYVLQSGYATLKISPEVAIPPGVKFGPPDFLTTLLFLRYRRRG